MYSGCWGRARSDLRGVHVCISSSLFCLISGIKTTFLFGKSSSLAVPSVVTLTLTESVMYLVLGYFMCNS
jgi:uncharacterized membrane protein YjjP (DUF1212 family)